MLLVSILFAVVIGYLFMNCLVGRCVPAEPERRQQVIWQTLDFYESADRFVVKNIGVLPEAARVVDSVVRTRLAGNHPKLEVHVYNMWPDADRSPADADGSGWADQMSDRVRAMFCRVDDNPTAIAIGSALAPTAVHVCIGLFAGHVTPFSFVGPDTLGRPVIWTTGSLGDYENPDGVTPCAPGVVLEITRDICRDMDEDAITGSRALVIFVTTDTADHMTSQQLLDVRKDVSERTHIPLGGV